MPKIFFKFNLRQSHKSKEITGEGEISMHKIFLIALAGLITQIAFANESTQSESSEEINSNDVIDLKNYCPRFKKSRDAKNFFRALNEHQADSSKTRRVFSYNKRTWYIEPQYAEQFQSRSKKLKYDTYQIIIEADGSAKLRCYYSPKKDEENQVHMTTFFPAY
jgi:hypothetical protein